MKTSTHTSIGGARTLALCAAVLTLLALGLAAPGESAAATERGTAAADTLTGTPRADRLFGLGGNDTLSGRAAADRLRGGTGEDKLTGGPGKDTMRGEAGADVLLARDGTADVVDCGSGNDVAVVDAADNVAANCEEVERPQKSSDVVTVPGPVVTVEKPAPEPETPPELEEIPLAMFPAGHGWTGNGKGTYTDAGPPFAVNNNRSFKIETNGLAEPSVASSPPLAPVDLRGSHVSFQSLVSFSSRLQSVKLRLSSGDIATDYAEATLWETTQDPIILGTTFEFQSVAPAAFDVVGEVDWSAIDSAQIVLTDNGLGPVALYVAGIYAVPTQERALISFTFDDTYASTFTRGLKKLSAYRFPATAYLIADIVDDPGRLTTEQLYELRDEHHWEITGHSLTIATHNLPNGLDELDPAELKAEMDGLRDWLDEMGFKRETFSYPKGAADHAVRKYVARDYCVGRSTAEGPETIPPRDDYTMRGWSINSEEDDADSVKAAIDRAVAQKSWLMLTWHDIVGGTPDEPTEFSDDEFDEVVDHVRGLQAAGKVKIRTVADALAAYC